MNVAPAGTIATTGEAVQATLPANLALGALQSNTQFRIMFKSVTTLGAALVHADPASGTQTYTGKVALSNRILV